MMFAATLVALTLVVFAVLAYRVSMLATASFTGAHADDPIDGAIAVARRRLLEGEISAEEYERVVSALRD